MSTLVQSLSKKPNFYQEGNYEKKSWNHSGNTALESSCQNNSSNSDRAVVKSCENNFETLWTLMIKKEIMKRKKKKLKPTKINHTAAQEINNTVYYNSLTITVIHNQKSHSKMNSTPVMSLAGRQVGLPRIWEFS